MTGAWLTLNATVGAIPGVVNAVLGVKSSAVNSGILIGAAISAVLYPFIGLLSQKFGRRPTIAVIGLLNLVPVCALYYVLVASGYRDPTTLITLVALIMVLSLPIWAVHTPYLAESFRTGIRSSGYGVSYSLATIIPGLYPVFMLGLGVLMPYAYTPIVLLALGGLFLSVGALAGEETKDVEFHLQDMPGKLDSDRTPSNVRSPSGD
jgi:MFS family permease